MLLILVVALMAVIQVMKEAQTPARSSAPLWLDKGVAVAACNNGGTWLPCLVKIGKHGD